MSACAARLCVSLSLPDEGMDVVIVRLVTTWLYVRPVGGAAFLGGGLRGEWVAARPPGQGKRNKFG